MSIKRILLLGAAGQIGQALQHHNLPVDWQLGSLTRTECDITDRRSVQQAVQSFKPDLVINAAAMTAVDLCEKEQDKAMAVNFEAAATIAAQCSTHDIPLIHLSTDYVFDGHDGGRPYTVHHKMSPLSVYGHSKMMGEEAIRHSHPWHAILRVSSVFSEFGQNLLPRMLNLIDTRDELKIVTDQISCPTYAPDIAEALVTMTHGILAGTFDRFGTFHYCGEPAVTRMEFVQAIMASYAPYTDRRPTIGAALSTDFPGLAERPVYSVLDCKRIHDVYGIAQRPWQTGLAKAIGILRTKGGQKS